MILDSYAKLNLYLEVVKKRKDGYHDLKTVFERISLADKIELKALPDKIIKVVCSHPDVPIDSSNLCFCAAKTLQDRYRVKEGILIRIKKNIPVGAGLGGGSGNAAAVLSGLNQLWNLRLSRGELVETAKKIGSDVAFFLYNAPFAEACGRGERIKPLKEPDKLVFWHILIVPRIKVSTPLVYRKWDEWLNNKKLRLTRPKGGVKLLRSALGKKDAVSTGMALFNSLEEVTLRLYPVISHIKRKLLQKGVKSILMSGSGPAVFGICSSRKEAVSLSRHFRQENKRWQVFIAGTI